MAIGHQAPPGLRLGMGAHGAFDNCFERGRRGGVEGEAGGAGYPRASGGVVGIDHRVGQAADAPNQLTAMP